MLSIVGSYKVMFSVYKEPLTVLNNIGNEMMTSHVVGPVYDFKDIQLAVAFFKSARM